MRSRDSYAMKRARISAMAIGSHVIPRFYLEQFAMPSARRGNPGRIWVYEREKEPDERATSVQGVENGYFGYVKPDGTLQESLETRLANLENECNDVLSCAKSELFNWHSYSHRKTIAFYASLLFQRATQSRNVSVQQWDYIQKGFAEAIADDKYVDDLALHYSAKVNQPVTRQEMRGYLQELSERMQKPSGAKNVFLEKLLWNSEFIKNVLLEKPWQVWKAPIGVEFVTSDNPLISFVRVGDGELNPGWGFRQPGVVAAFPVAPTTCLAMGVRGPESVTLDAADVMKVNELVIRLCDRFVYSRTRSEEIRKTVDVCAGAAKYGVTAFMPSGIQMPSVREFIRHYLGLAPEVSKPVIASISKASAERDVPGGS